MEHIRIQHGLMIPVSEVRFRYSRSSGKGGQNVNKVETKVELLFDIAKSPSLPDDQRELILKHLKSYIDTKGTLRIVSQESRSQWKNREIVKKRFITLLQSALRVRKKRRATKVPASSIEKRLKEKKIRGHLKAIRKNKFGDLE
jgi:ribosome-associated protein